MKRLMIAALASLIVMVTILALPGEAGQVRSPDLNWELILPDRPVRIQPAGIDDMLYVSTDRDLRRTNDDGETWSILYPLPPLTETLGVSAMTFDPGPAGTPALFLARNVPDGPAEIYRSTDDALSWTTVFSSTAGPLYDLGAARNGDGQLVVFAVGGQSVWRSEDGGESWAPAEDGLPEGADIYRVFLSPAFAVDGTVYLTGFGPLMRSTDGGDSWSAVMIPDVDIVRQVVFSPQYAADQTLWASYFFVEGSGESDPNGVIRSTDGGQTWEIVNQGLPVDYLDGWIMGLAVSPDYPADPSLYLVERALQYDGTAWEFYRSPAGGDGWWEQGFAPEATPNGLLATGRDLFFLPTQSGLWRLQNHCWEWLVNGDAEQNEGWQMPVTPATAQYSTDQAHSGMRSIRIGLINTTNRYAYSSARQPVTVPDSAESATLHFWLYPVSTEVEMALPPAAFPAGAALQPQAGDAQYVLVLDEDLNILEVLLWTLADSRTWQEYTFDLSDYTGRTVWLHFGVYNDGFGGITGMYLDDASLLACEPRPLTKQLYLPVILNSEPPAGALLIEGEWAGQVIGHPQSDTLYAVTASGLYRSDDGAVTWEQTGSPPPVTRTILVAPGEPAVLYAGEGLACLAGGDDMPLWKSVDSGQTWTELPAGLNLEPLAVHPADSGRVYARGCTGPYLTTDGGATWQLQDNDLFDTYEARFAAPAPADDWQTVYLGCVTEGGGGGIIGSQDGGVNWDLVSPLNPELWAVSAMPADPLPLDEVYFAEPHAFWGSTDGGATWYTSTAGLEDVIYDPGGPITRTYGLLSMSVLPGEDWLLGTVRGLYRTTDPQTGTWFLIMEPAWQEERVTALLRRWSEPQKIFVTTPAGVYITYNK